ncbi:MAG TPA: CooT family nickel-binding protein [Patescibacteria group bacterium]|nr:CooT family nickel-binding protein [Patescibacteria group bacterium]
MCEANAYMYQDEKEELLLEFVDKVVPGDGEIYLENIFGQRKTVAARIRELRLIDHRIILERITDEHQE